MSFPRYHKYKASGVEWLGDVPEHWDVKRIGYYFKERREKVSDKDFPALSVTKSGIVPQLDTAAKSDDGDNRKKVLKGDFVINSRSDRKGSSGASELDGSVSLICTVMRAQEQVHTPFVHHLLRSQPFQEEFYRNGKGIVADLWSTNYSEMRNILLGMPPLQEQNRIAEFLNQETAKIDELVEEQQRLMELLKEKRQAMISHAVTKGLIPNVPMKASGIEWLGDVPDHWEEFPLKALFALKHGYPFDSEEFSDSGKYVLMTPGNFNERGGFRSKVQEKFYVGIDIPEDFILQSGQLLVAMTEQAPGLLGSALFVPDRMSYLHNQRLGLVHKLRRDLLSEQYLFHVFNSSRIRAEISISSTGAKVKHTSPQKILSVKLFLPPLSEQKQIASFLDEKTATIDALEAAAERAIELLQERRIALISAAVTGQIEVRPLLQNEAA
jgi:type I restriction enzyme, S subunit